MKTIGPSVRNTGLIVGASNISLVEECSQVLSSEKSGFSDSVLTPMARTRPISEHIAYLLAQANRQVEKQLDDEFRGEGVPVEQWRILTLLTEKNGRSMSNLTRAALLNHPTLTKMIDRMVSDALVYRRADPADGRRVLIFISERGRAVNERLNRLANQHQAELVEDYGDRQTEALRRLLGDLIQRTG